MLPEGHQLGHYRVVSRIGSGGMGEVYLAEDTRINRQVAIKVVRAETEPYPDPVAEQDALRLFQREMRAITMLDHPHILPLFDFGEEKDGNMALTYMVMPYRQAGSLADWLQKRENSEKLTSDEVAHFVTQAADALQHAHEHHLIHQDVKPANFLVRERTGNILPDLLLMDFGVVKITTATATASQNVRGTPAFMAPEQWEGQPQPATDQYALALMAYLLLTGHTPFSGRMEQVMRQHFMVQPQPPRISPALDAVILRALEKDPAKRFPSILEFAQAFQQALQPTGNQEPIVLVPKKEEASTPSGDTAESEKKVQAASVLLPPTVYPVKSGELAPTVPASDFGPSAQVSAPDAESESPASETPKLASLVSPAPFASKKVGSADASRLILTLFVVLLVIIASVISIGISVNHQNQMNAAATTTAQANDETAIAQAQTTATAQVIANNPYPSYLSESGTLTFVDPLSQESGSQWSSYRSSDGFSACQFTGGAYHAVEQQGNVILYCTTGARFSNFALEVQLTIIQGDCGGMIFRDDGNRNFYFFQVCQNGSYSVSKYVSKSSSTNLGSGKSSAIQSGLGQQNKMAVIASGSTMTFYLNGQSIVQVQDSSYTSGRIGLVASDQSQATDVAYSNAKLWTL